MAPLSEYERILEENRRNNEKLLKSLGVPINEKPNVISQEEYEKIVKKKARKSATLKVKKRSETSCDSGERRRSDRLCGKTPRRYNDEIINGDYDFKPKRKKVSLPDSYWSGRLDPSTYKYKKPNFIRPMTYGEIEGVPLYEIFQSRMECNYAGIHRPPVAGIHGGPDGAYSIALNAGYEDDVDMGDRFTYTGAGGRDLKGTPQNPKNLRTAEQSKDQSFINENESLRRSEETRNPVRVVRGPLLNNQYAPASGYRYDGLYTVEKAWMDTGLSGFLVCRFALIRCPDQPPIPIQSDTANASEDEID